MDFSTRLPRLQAALEKSQLDGLVYGIGANLQYFTGLCSIWQRMHEPAEPDCLLVLGRGSSAQLIMTEEVANQSSTVGLPRIIVQSRSDLIAALRLCLGGKRIGVGRSAEKYLCELVGAALHNAECVEAENFGEVLRYQKDAEEVAQLRRAAALADQVMARVVSSILPGITQLELQHLIVEAGRELGAEAVSFPPAALFVKSGTPSTEDPFVYPKEAALVAGTSIAFDFGFVLEGYCSDFGRSFYSGPAPKQISHAYRALQAAQCYLISQMKPGLRLGELFGILEAHLDQHGFGDRLRARVLDGTLGHQIGVDLHENPWVRRGCDLELQPGMVMAIEPKLWLPGEYYLRVEDIVLIQEDGAEFLNHFDRELFELPL